uniref:Uncharacterized protein n=1 Tax=Timema poppense TaxID=170557 RepID=A0A7R9DB37_TIMPO|nr:unnamed protein product [Timema poppensis]
MNNIGRLPIQLELVQLLTVPVPNILIQIRTGYDQCYNEHLTVKMDLRRGCMQIDSPEDVIQA